MAVNIARFTNENIALTDTGGYSTPEDSQIKKIDVIKSSINNEIEEYDFEAEGNDTSSDISTLSEDDLQLLVGSMTKEEYEEFIEGIQEYYDSENEQLRSNLDNLNEMYDNLEFYCIGENRFSDYQTNEPDCSDRELFYYEQWENYKNEIINIMKSEGININTQEEFYNLSTYDKLKFLKEYDTETQNRYASYESSLNFLNEKISDELSDYGITSYDELIQTIDLLELTIKNIDNAIKTNENAKASAQYDYLIYLDDYDSYNLETDTSLLETLDEDSDMYDSASPLYALAFNKIQDGLVYSYTKYSEKHPDVSPLEYIKMVKEKTNNGVYTINGISNQDDLNTLIEVSEKYPNLEKTYNYLYKISPDDAEQFLEDCKYEINNFEGQLRANEFLSTLDIDDGDDDKIGAILNELSVSFEGISDGVVNFGDGIKYSGEALVTFVGKKLGFDISENRTLSPEEYKKMYILYALLSTESKEEAGLIIKNEDGTYANADANSIIDYTLNYSGAFLNNNYEISQGIGNMLPSIAISTFCPIAGSISMGFSAGGNSYHNSMVNGHSLYSSILYGILTGASEAVTERMLGGIPGLSDLQVTSLRTYALSIVHESGQEMLQGVLDEVTKAVILGEPLPKTKEEWEEFAKDIGKQGLYGAITAGIMNVPVLASAIKIKKDFKNQCEINNISDTEKADFFDMVRKSTKDGLKLTDDQIIINYGYLLFGGIDIAQAKIIINSDEKIRTETLNQMSGEDLLNTFKFISKINPDVMNKIMNVTDSKYLTTLTTELLKPTLDYYQSAKKFANQAEIDKFMTYRNHCEEHVQEVAQKTIQAVKDIQTALNLHGVKGFSSNVNLYECYIAALWHDTGMAAGADGIIGLDSYYDTNGNIQTQILSESNGGNDTRKNHSFNSAMSVLINSSEISKLGVDPNVIAILCFAHSKSNSGVSTLNSAVDWNVCINKIKSGVELYNKINPNNPIIFQNTGTSNFIDSLVASGILLDSNSEKASTVYIKKNKEMSVNYDSYNINPEIISSIASEAFALRLGDANTTNQNIGTNQAGQKIDIDSISGDITPSFEEMKVSTDITALVQNEAAGVNIKIGDNEITLDTFGAAYILGENNIKFDTRTDITGHLVERFTILNPDQVPACTAFNIEERIGETDTARNGGFRTKLEIVLNSEGISSSQKTQIENYYKSFAKYKAYNYDVKVIWKKL